MLQASRNHSDATTGTRPAKVAPLHSQAPARNSWDLDSVVTGLRAVRERWRHAQQRQR